MAVGEGLILDVLQRVTKHMEQTDQLLAKFYELIQRQEAEKTPGDFDMWIINIKCATGPTAQDTQLLPRNNRREAAFLYNEGGDDLILSSTPFDPNSILQQVSDPNYPNAITPAPNQVVRVGILYSKASVRITSQGSIRAYNVGGTGALVNVAETLYATSGEYPRRPEQNGMSGLAWHGYQPNGAKALT